MRFRGLVCCLVVLIAGLSANSQAPSGPPQSPQKPGMSSGIAAGVQSAPQYDEEKRPITAGGFVDKGAVVFEDVTKSAGLSGWIHKMGVPQKQFIVETNGSGVCLIDYNNDGWLDIYLVNGSTFDALDGKEPAPHAALFRNNHDGTFTDVSKEAVVQNDRWGYGCSVADYDNDGWPDLYVGNYGKNRLYHNNHDGTFTDVAEIRQGGPRQLVAWLNMGRLRRRRQTRPLRHRLCPLRPREPSHCWNQGRWIRLLPLPRSQRELRSPRVCSASQTTSFTTTETANSLMSLSRPA